MSVDEIKSRQLKYYICIFRWVGRLDKYIDNRQWAQPTAGWFVRTDTLVYF